MAKARATEAEIQGSSEMQTFHRCETVSWQEMTSRGQAVSPYWKENRTALIRVLRIEMNNQCTHINKRIESPSSTKGNVMGEKVPGLVSWSCKLKRVFDPYIPGPLVLAQQGLYFMDLAFGICRSAPLLCAHEHNIQDL